MKKIIITLIALIVAFTTLFSFGCGTSTFSGDYKTQATTDEISKLANDIKDADTTTESWECYEMSYDMQASFTLDGESISQNITFKGIFNEKQEAHINVKIKGTQKGEIDIYQKGAKSYVNTKMGENSMKIVTELDVFEVMSYYGISVMDFSIVDDFNSYLTAVSDKMKVYIDAQKDTTKVKMDLLPIYSDESGMEFSKLIAFYVFDSNKNLTAIKAEMSLVMGEEANSKIDGSCVMEKKSNLEITFPTDLDQYVNTGLVE